jgi:hypothetical protein
MEAKETDELRQIMKLEIHEAIRCLANLKAGRETLRLLLESSLEDLQ